jgi:rare lipoprotein A
LAALVVATGPLLPAACAASPDGRVTAGEPAAVAPAPARAAEIGIASWYGAEHHGRRTASGEPFDMNAATAAHPTLPFGTQVRVTNLANGRAIVLRVNDRGPFVGGRIIDVSRHAAGQLGFRRAGTARVRVEILESAQG